MNLSDLHTFHLVAETGTMTAAAEKLAVPKSTVSRRIRRLEDALGHELFRRSPKRIELTESGRSLHMRSSAALVELQYVVDKISNSNHSPTGVLRITTTPGFAQSHYFIKCIHDYGIAFPKVSLDIHASNSLINLSEEGFDIGIRLHSDQLKASPNLMSKKLLRFTRAIYASPTYLEKHGCPSSFEDLSQHRLAVHSLVDIKEGKWSLYGEGFKGINTLPSPQWVINDSSALERFALEGAGLALLSSFEGDFLVESGLLVKVLSFYEQKDLTATLIWPESRHLAPRIRTFIDHIYQFYRAI